MEAGAIAFYNGYDDFQNALKGMGINEHDLCLEPDDFYKRFNYDIQAAYQLLLSRRESWGFICRPVNKKNGTKAFKILNHDDDVREITADSVYFAMEMTDYVFSQWNEMDNPHKITKSKNGSPVRKTPSPKNIKDCIKQSFLFDNNKMLYHIVECEDAYYSDHHPFNTQWNDYAPYYTTPQDYLRQKQGRQQQPWNPNPSYPYNPGRKKTLHAVPFLRSNIKPVALKVVKKTALYENDLRIFWNYPNGIPLVIR